ncbi:PKD domain-containing protein [Mucilaginibacter conchicola]|uniref:PKD domain-containing protein n=1 Tax=Mucilaginibacter conchicola TaxID=2303333 RepID=A0A372NVW0_9SPHI|nr:PKD domain-containing protein [Mucilaginibacter conchicola]RFZ94273.1 PKD domain-containing protein [Mucilaginibacter conchicola]
MGKIFTKGLFLLFFFLLITRVTTAQTITIGAVDAGPYGQGSTIAVPVTIDNTSGCITASTNTFRLYLSDASGSFASQVQIGSYAGFYATFVNGIIPSGTPAGTGYRVRVVSTNPSVTSSTSAAFTINNAGGVIAATSSQTIGSNTEVFGSCVGNGNSTPFAFIDISTTGSTTTGTFINELNHAVEANNQPLPYTFDAKLSNYTVIVKATKGGIVGTKAYTLINNVVFRNLGGSGDNIYCLGAGSTATFTITIDNGALNGIRYNYPGLTYRVNWGDGTSNVYTYCQLAAANGAITHAYTRSSCGNQIDNQNNVFKVDVTPINPYCSSNVSPSSAYAKILTPPTNRFTFPAAACTNNAVRFDNISDPGQDPNSSAGLCENQNAQYTWLVDGVPVAVNRTLNQPLIHTFTTHGTHTVTLRLQNNTGLCTAVDVSHDICVQDAPTIAFTLPTTICLSSGTVTPQNNSVVDETCNTSTTYNWVRVAGPASGVTYNASLKTPTFTFNQIGVYQFRLDIATISCGTIQGPTKTILVNNTPVADLSPNTTICTVNAPISFDPNAAETKTNFDGTAQSDATTYTWELNNGATFATGSNSHTQYPQIIFPTTGVYTVKVTHQNNCGTNTDTQQITIANGPTVTATAPSPICEGSVANLTGSPGVGGIVTAVRWTSPTGTALNFANANAPVTTYTPTAADIAAGQVVLTYTTTTSLGGACGTVAKNVTVLITRKATITSVANPTICTGANLAYTITSPTATSYNWTAALTSGTATGFSTTGTTSTINDVITNTGTANAVVTYTITPNTGTCPGNVFTLTVTILPNAVGGTTAGATTVCQGSNTGQVTLSDSYGSIVWQQSTNGGTSWVNVMPLQGGSTLIYNNITQTTLYRAAVTSGNCSMVFSTPTTITVNPQTPTANAGADPNPICNQSVYTLQGNNPGTFTGAWTQVAGPAANIVNSAAYNSQVTGLAAGNSYTFRWTIKGLPPCANSFDEVTIAVKADVIANFTMDNTQVCGATPIQFTNTSTPLVAGTQYLWNFGDGTPTSTDVNPSHTYIPNADGTTATYIVSLSIQGNCNPRGPVIKQITVSGAQPNPAILVNNKVACGTLTLSVQNLTAGNNISYEYHLVDASGTDLTTPILKTNNDKSNADFPPVQVTQSTSWFVYMDAVNSCGASGRSPQTQISVSPSGPQSNMQFKDNITSVCVGSPVVFRNLSSGGETYTYTIYDENRAQLTSIKTSNTNDINYPFATAGNYFVSVRAANTGCGDGPESDLLPITVYPLPEPSFTYTVDVNNKVTFVNTTPAAGTIPAAALTYTWKFGDGSVNETAITPLPHQYNYENSPYTVTLTAATPSGCSKDFTRKIEIKFTGELFLPNAFQPASSTSELRAFKAKGQKLKEWRLQIFNNWGQLIWQTSALTGDGSPADGWDGTYNGQPVPQGVYVWQATAKFINGAEWKGNSLNGSLPKRTGVIHLIR